MPERKVYAQKLLQAPAPRIFDVLADPRNHARLSGDGSVRDAHPGNPERLSHGAVFRMRVHMVIPYWITNEVVHFEENHAIAWKHYAGHTWRWTLDPRGPESCLVTETFDYSTTLTPNLFAAARVPQRNLRNIEKTLTKLAKWTEEAR
ncbi:SRPBCC family protein [Streptomyces sp. NPDC091272]|uniref:SRPBCC family protein n=1 Tax=Streptomyces sp. NPDC091272 TaxID=3365981 RepID=UPI0037F77C29